MRVGKMWLYAIGLISLAGMVQGEYKETELEKKVEDIEDSKSFADWIGDRYSNWDPNEELRHHEENLVQAIKDKDLATIKTEERALKRIAYRKYFYNGDKDVNGRAIDQARLEGNSQDLIEYVWRNDLDAIKHLVAWDSNVINRPSMVRSPDNNLWLPIEWAYTTPEIAAFFKEKGARVTSKFEQLAHNWSSSDASVTITNQTNNSVDVDKIGKSVRIEIGKTMKFANINNGEKRTYPIFINYILIAEIRCELDAKKGIHDIWIVDKTGTAKNDNGYVGSRIGPVCLHYPNFKITVEPYQNSFSIKILNERSGCQ